MLSIKRKEQSMMHPSFRPKLPSMIHLPKHRPLLAVNAAGTG